MKISGWGRYPIIQSNSVLYQSDEDMRHRLNEVTHCIARGNARSYGDSALSESHFSLLQRNRILSFDEETGLIQCEAGVLLADIVEVFLSRGWFLKVTPGTKWVSVGGAIASDVHGKNHHVEGCFGESLESLTLMMPNGEIVVCSQSENRELFLATCGGMGLTGIILEASFYLTQVRSKNIDQITIKNSNLTETFDAFNRYEDTHYSVAWIDCLARKEDLGRSLLMVGDFAQDGDLNYQTKKTLTVPFDFPQFTLNHYTIKAFNQLYYSKVNKVVSNQTVDVDSFFYPLDSINQWNRIYGRKGFIQYQFILPLEQSYEGLQAILQKMADSGMGSFLAVLKLHGPENDNYLSFPLKGYSLALDFKMQKGLFELLNELDAMVVDYGGRFYLAKDSRVSRYVFEKGYPNIEKFRQLRKNMGLDKKYKTLQSERLGL